MKREKIIDYWIIEGSICFQNAIISKEMIEARIGIIKHFFADHDLTKLSVVAIFLERSENAIILMYALLSMGIAFLNVDVSLPENRWRYMLGDIKADIVVTEKKRMGWLNDRPDSIKKIYDIEDIVYYQNFSNKLRNIGYYSHEQDIAYYLYTSGTTGKPKAVEITQKGLRNFIKAIPEQIPLQKGMRILCSTSMSFDIFFLESILALRLGLQVVLASEKERKNVKKLLNLIGSKQVDVIQMTPSHLRMLQNYDKRFQFLEVVKFLLIGGEALPESLLKNLQKESDCRIFNMYGPTETTIWSSVAELTNSNEVNIGEPILNTKLYILNNDFEQVPDGEKGEIYISGEGLANGYKGDPELTTQKFISPFADEHLRLYRTGDIGTQKNGTFYWFGRNDNQIKYRGHRIELEEIDACINDLESVNATVSYLNTETEDSFIETIFTGEARNEEVRAFLKQRVPSYMVPKKIVKVDHLLLTSSGKIDREGNRKKYLTEFNVCTQNEKKTVESKLMNRVLKIFADCLPEVTEKIIPEMSIERLGIDSLDFIKLVVQIEDDFEIIFEEKMLLFEKYDTVKDFILYVEYLLDQKNS